jgi:hypothetical protein
MSPNAYFLKTEIVFTRFFLPYAKSLNSYIKLRVRFTSKENVLSNEPQ